MSGGGKTIGGNATAGSPVTSTSPVATSFSLATAPMSPGPISWSGTCSLPWSVKSCPSRSLEPLRTQVAWLSLGRVPEKTRSRLMRPLNWSATVLKQ